MSTFDEGAVRALYGRIVAGWNARDAEAMAGGFADDGSMVGYDGSQVDARHAIAAHLKPIFADHPTAAYVARVREVRPLGADAALLRAVAGMVPPGASELKPALNTVHTLVAVRDGDDWRAALFQSTPAAWHARPDDVAALTTELTEQLRSGSAVG